MGMDRTSERARVRTLLRYRENATVARCGVEQYRTERFMRCSAFAFAADGREKSLRVRARRREKRSAPKQIRYCRVFVSVCFFRPLSARTFHDRRKRTPSLSPSNRREPRSRCTTLKTRTTKQPVLSSTVPRASLT
jgi:hypothetical protein